VPGEHLLGRRVLREESVTRRTALRVAGLLLAVASAFVGLRALARSRTVQLFGPVIARVPTLEPRVALTFDDGPTSARVDTLLGLLGARGVRATFFVTGRELALAPEAGRRLVAAGHELGNHTYSHRRLVLVAPSTVRGEVERTDSLIRAVGHVGGIHFRPPYGYKLVALPWYLARSGRTTVTWDVEPDSYAEVAATPAGIVRHVLARVRPGSIILLHPWYASRATSLAAVGPLIDSLQARGFRVGPVRDLVR
jgi:peptidoglycan/xylan/chitin deacetylase (PgdA/CDA1 family)